MKNFELDTRNWDNMTDMEVLYDYTKHVADYAYRKGVKNGAIGMAVGTVVGIISLAAVEMNMDKIKRKVKDIKTKIKMKLEVEGNKPSSFMFSKFAKKTSPFMRGKGRTWLRLLLLFGFCEGENLWLNWKVNSKKN